MSHIRNIAIQDTLLSFVKTIRATEFLLRNPIARADAQMAKKAFNRRFEQRLLHKPSSRAFYLCFKNIVKDFIGYSKL